MVLYQGAFVAVDVGGLYMIKKMLLFSTTFMVVSSLTTNSVLADVGQNSEPSTQFNNHTEREDLSFAVSIENGNFVLDSGLRILYSDAEWQFLQDEVAKANQTLAGVRESGVTLVQRGEGFVAADSQSTLSREKRGFGKTAVKFHWWGVRVWLNRDHTRIAAAGGFTIAGFFVTGPIASAAMGVLGFGSSFIPSGIQFDYNYITRQVSNIRLQ
jgi:hypothetical protein